MDALELSGTKLSPAIFISFWPASFYQCHTPEMPRKQAFPGLPPTRFLATPLGWAFTLASPRTINRRFPCKSTPCANTQPSGSWTIVAQIKEVGSGAAQRERRATLMRCRTDGAEIDVVLVWRLDRWGRVRR